MTFNDWPCIAGLLNWNRLPLTSVNHYWHHTNDSVTTLTLSTKWKERPNFTTDGDRLIPTDLRHLSLTANNITAKLTNQFIQTGLRTLQWQQLFTRLRWWLPLTLPDDQTTLLHVTPRFKPFTVQFSITTCRKDIINIYRNQNWSEKSKRVRNSPLLKSQTSLNDF